MTWWESCLAVLVGAFLAAIIIAANGWVGSVVHTPFAVTCRATYGYWGSKFVVLVSHPNRVMAFLREVALLSYLLPISN